MTYPGDLGGPLPRTTRVDAPVVNGYAAFRLRRQGPLIEVSGSCAPANIYLENTDTTYSATLQVRTCDDPNPPANNTLGNPTGTRINLGAPVTIVPGGFTTLQVTPGQTYLEAWGTGTTGAPAGNIVAQVSGITRWDVIAFAKTDPTYPSSLWASNDQLLPLPANLTTIIDS